MRLKYQCEGCGTVYGTEREATLCESSPPPEPCPFKAGDEVVFGDDNRNDCRDTVVRVYLGPSHLPGGLKTWGGDVDEFLAQVGRGSRPLRFHAWYVKLKHEWKWGDEAYSDTIPASSLQPVPSGTQVVR